MSAPDDFDRPEGPAAAVLDGLDRRVRHWRNGLVRIAPAPLVAGWTVVGRTVNRALPKSLLGRSLLIIVLPMIILQAVLVNVFMDRHWQLVTSRLSAGMVRDIAAVVDLVEALPDGQSAEAVLAVGERRLLMDLDLLPMQPIRAFDRADADTLLDKTLSGDLRRAFGRPFGLDTDVDGRFVEVVLPLDRGTLKVRFNRNLAYAANWHFFLVWMVGTSFLLMVFSAIFLRNQIRPIQRLANAAEAFGKGRPVPGFAPQGAREVRKAAHAFIEMRRRIERQIEQRTTMLAGVSHDLRTILTRFRLELALMPEGEEAEALRRDVDEMEAMLEAYVAFAKGAGDEDAAEVDVHALVADVARRIARPDRPVHTTFAGEATATVRPGAFRRLVANLVGNAVRYGNRVEVRVERRDGWLTLLVDDDGPGIPPAERDNVFRPFYRLDAARNQNETGTGLGLAIARDIARAHGGEIRLDGAPAGGLRVVVRVPG